MEIRPVAFIHNCFSDKFGIPRQSGRAPAVLSRIVFEPEYRSDDALRGIGGFDYLWLVFGFSLTPDGEFSPTVRPPRLGGNRRVGVFASRSPFRPNRLGLSSVRLVSVEKTPQGSVLVVAGADLADSTPIYDVKPYLPFTDSHPGAACGYAGEHESDQLTLCDPEGRLATLPDDLREAAAECLRDDPRPSYIDEPGREYGMTIGGYNLRFTVSDGCVTVTGAEKNEGVKKVRLF